MIANTPIVITQGEKAIFNIYLKNEDGRPFDLTNFDVFKVCLEVDGGTLLLTQAANANGSFVDKASADEIGHLVVTVGPVDSETLKIEDLTDIGVELNNSVTPNKRRLVIERGLKVTPFC